jgi:hypothetical protein
MPAVRFFYEVTLGRKRSDFSIPLPNPAFISEDHPKTR